MILNEEYKKDEVREKSIPKKVVKVVPPKKEKSEIFLDKISPEIMKSFHNHPEYGTVKIEITYHEGQPVKVECGKSIKKKLVEL